LGWIECTHPAKTSKSVALWELFDPGLLAEGDLPVVVVFFEEAVYVEDFAVHGLVLRAHDGGVSEDPDFH